MRVSIFGYPAICSLDFSLPICYNDNANHLQKGKKMGAANSLKSLVDVKAGDRAVVKELRGGRGFVARVASLGLIPGAEVEVIRNPQHGPIIIRIKGSYFALGRGEAAKVLVEDSA